MDLSIPAVTELANFPQHCGKPRRSDGAKCCIMCGSLRLVCDSRPREPSEAPCIHSSSRGVCTTCEVSVWVLAESGLRIKSCSKCKCFCHVAAFCLKNRANHTNGGISTLCCSNCRNCQVNYQKVKQGGGSPSICKVATKASDVLPSNLNHGVPPPTVPSEIPR